MKKIDIGIVGAGRMGRFYAELLANGIPGAELKAISGSSGAAFAKNLHIEYYPDHVDLLRSAIVKAVIICTRTPSHAGLAIAAAREGKHIFLEKPIALTIEDADRVIEEALNHGVFLTIGFMRRFDPSYRYVKEQIDCKIFGTPIGIRGVHRSTLPPDWVLKINEGGGLALDYLVHEYDLARWLLGDEIQTVYAVGGVLANHEKNNTIPDFIDQLAVLMQMENGATAALEACCAAEYAYDVRTEVLGSKGMATVGELKENHATTFLVNQGELQALNHSFLNRFEEAFRCQMEHFIACIQQDRQPLVTGFDGRAALCAGLAALTSLREGKPVKVVR